MAPEREAVAIAARDGAGVETRITRRGAGGLMATNGQKCLDMDIFAYPWQFVDRGRHFCLIHCWAQIYSLVAKIQIFILREGMAYAP